MTPQPSSRTPEGEDNRCAVCGNLVRIDPSRPPGDAVCPHCGTLLWFGTKPIDSLDPNQAEAIWERATTAIANNRFSLAKRLLLQAIELEPGNESFRQTLESLGSPITAQKARRRKRMGI
jgi:hypothetical protein